MGLGKLVAELAPKASGLLDDAYEGAEEIVSGLLDYASSPRVPKNTVDGYKLFRTKPNDDSLYPLFVDRNTPVAVGDWSDAIIGGAGKGGKVKSSIGDLAMRPGWHAADVPVATHIGGRSVPGLKGPDYRPPWQQWANISMGNDRNWQEEATSRARKTAAGDIDVSTAHITDQIPEMGHYRYKTNPNMTGEWLIGGEMKINDTITAEQAREISRQAGLDDLPLLPEVMLNKGLTINDLTSKAIIDLHDYYPDAFNVLAKDKSLTLNGMGDDAVMHLSKNQPELFAKLVREKGFDIDSMKPAKVKSLKKRHPELFGGSTGAKGLLDI